MDYTHVGRLGLRCRRLCLGTMNFGPHTPEADSHTRSWTAPLEHGDQLLRHRERVRAAPGAGATEEIIGRWFAQGRAAAATKVVSPRRCSAPTGDWPNESRSLGAVHQPRVRGSRCAACRPTTSTSTRCTTSTATRRGTNLGGDGAARCGRARLLYVGSSNFAGWHIAQAQRDRARASIPRPRQRSRSFYNLHARTVELEVIPACRGTGWADPVEPAGRRRARRTRWRRCRRAAFAGYLLGQIDKTRPNSTGWSACARSWGSVPPTSPSHGCFPAGGDRADISTAPSTSCSVRWGAPRSAVRRRPRASWT